MNKKVVDYKKKQEAKQTKEPMSEEEIQAAGHVAGLQNLGMDFKSPSNFDNDQRIKAFQNKDWNRVKGLVLGHLGNIAESDEMYEGMLDEINSWVKIFRKPKAVDLQMWEEDKVKYSK